MEGRAKEKKDEIGSATKAMNERVGRLRNLRKKCRKITDARREYVYVKK